MIEQTIRINKVDIGAALIVKNSEKSVSSAISSVKQVCSQIVVTDTGSLDNTPSVCSRYGAELHFRNWTDDFSEARNYTLNFIRTQWVISIDSDEILDFNSFYENIKLFDSDSTGGIRVKLINHLQEGTIREHFFPRIFRNNKLIRFSGRIHEQIGESITDAGFEIVDSGIIIHHYGYSKDAGERIKRNTELINLEIKDNPDDDWLKYHQAETLFSDADFTESQRIYEEIYDSGMLSTNQKEFCKLRLAQIALNNNEFAKTDKWTDFSASNPEAEGLRLYIRTSSSLSQGKIYDAGFYFKQINDSNNNLINKSIYTKIFNLLNN